MADVVSEDGITSRLSQAFKLPEIADRGTPRSAKGKAEAWATRRR